MITRGDILEFMRGHSLAVQASVSASSIPQAAVVGFIVTDDFEIFFDTVESTRKISNLRGNSRIAFVIGGLITSGPYGYVRHPRYLGPIVSRLATALTFASIIGWLLLVGWIAVVLRRIRLEESHLHRIFGATYVHYARFKPLIPGLY